MMKTNKFIWTRVFLIIISIIILDVSLQGVVAFEFDNVKDYDPDTRTITITNLFGFGDVLAEIRLIGNSDVCSTHCYAIGEIDLRTRSKLIDKISFELGRISSYQIYIQNGTVSERVQDYGNSCSEVGRDYNNDSIIDENVSVCNRVKKGSHFEDYPVWDLYDGSELDPGIYRWKIEGRKKWDETVDWIGEWLGIRVTEWALWSGSEGAIAYYSLNGTSGDAVNAVLGHPNATLSPTGIERGLEGIINNSYNFSGGFLNLSKDLIFNFTSNFSISFWINRIAGNGNTDVVMSKRQEANLVFDFVIQPDDTVLARVKQTDGTLISNFLNISANSFQHIVWLANGSDILVYVNATEVSKSSYDGTISGDNLHWIIGQDGRLGDVYEGRLDEIGFWNRTLSPSEVIGLYRGGVGLPFGQEASLQVVLDNPADNLVTLNTTIIFNTTLTTVDVNLTNATIDVWFSNGTLFNQTTNIVTGLPVNTTGWELVNISFNVFNWNVFACGIDGAGLTVCESAPQNFTFTVQQFTEVNQDFNANVSETDSQLFEINVSTVSSIISVTANLVYNGTSHSGITTCDVGSCNSKATIDIPLVQGSGESQIKSFFWNITVFDGSGSISAVSTTQEQNVSRIHLEQCDATFTVQALNFTAFDETDNTRINPFYFAGDFDFWLGSGTVKRDNSFSNTSTTEFNLCISPADRNFTIDAEIEYNDIINSTTYNTRNYFFQQDIINNQSQDIFLFLLNVDDSTSFILKVQDTNLLPVVDALIIIQRFDPGSGNFTTVSIAKTDDNGQTVGFFKTETVDYRFIIKKDGVTLLTTGTQKVVPGETPFTLTFTVGADVGAPWTRFEDLSNLTKSLVFNSSTAIVSFTYVDISGDFTLSRLLVVAQNLSGLSPTICDVNSTQSSAILTCNTGNVTGTYVASGFITRGSDVFLVEQIIFKVETFASVAGLFGVFLAWFIILVSAFAFKFNEIAGMVLMNLTVIFVNIIGLVNFGLLFIFGMMGVTVIIMVLLKK